MSSNYLGKQAIGALIVFKFQNALHASLSSDQAKACVSKGLLMVDSKIAFKWTSPDYIGRQQISCSKVSANYVRIQGEMACCAKVSKCLLNRMGSIEHAEGSKCVCHCARINGIDFLIFNRGFRFWLYLKQGSKKSILRLKGTELA